MSKAATKTSDNEAAEQAAPAPKPKAPLVVKADACKLAPYSRNEWEITLPPGTKPEELLARDALGVIAQQCQPKDLIFAQPSDAAWLGVYRVVAVDPTSLQLALLAKYDLPERVHDGGTDPAGFKIDRDDARGWFILREADGVILGQQSLNPDLRSKEACRRYVYDHPTVRGPRAPVYS